VERLAAEEVEVDVDGTEGAGVAAGWSTERGIGPVLPDEDENPYLSASSHKRVRISSPTTANPSNPYMHVTGAAAATTASEHGPTSPSFTPSSPVRFNTHVHPTSTTATTTSDPYLPLESGDYPLPGSSSVHLAPALSAHVRARTSALGMGREEASKRSSNAMWWAGYWAAYSEMLPPLSGV